jgi:hypothetical protein
VPSFKVGFIGVVIAIGGGRRHVHPRFGICVRTLRPFAVDIEICDRDKL